MSTDPGSGFTGIPDLRINRFWKWARLQFLLRKTDGSEVELDSSSISAKAAVSSEDAEALLNQGFISNPFNWDPEVDLIIPEGVYTDIEEEAFKRKRLKSVKIPNSIEKIHSGAFFNNSLKSVEIPGNVKSIGDNAFVGNGMEELIINDC